MNHSKQFFTAVRSAFIATILSTLCCLPLTALATTFNSNGSQADVQAKINSAVDDDTVIIPAGTFTWTSGVTISGKGIKIQGAGGGRVEGSSTSTVTIGTGTKSFTIRTGSTINGFTVAETLTVRDKFVTGNTMTGIVTAWNGTTLVMNITAATGSSPSNKWTFESAATTTIIHNSNNAALFTVTKDASHSTEFCDLQFAKGTSTWQNAVNTGGTGKPTLFHDLRLSSIGQSIRDSSNGIIVWKCYFDVNFNISTDYTNNFNGIIMPEVSQTASWTDANTVGMNDVTGTRNIYIEQCYFIGHVLGAVDCSDNFRGVLRNCIFDNSGITIHGQDTGPYGMRHLEVYGNLFIFDALPEPNLSGNLNYWISWRGGSGLVTDNTVDDISSWSWGNKAEFPLEYQPLGRTNTAQFGVYGWPGGTDGTVVRYPASHQPGQGSNGAAAWFTYSGSPSLATATNTYTEGIYCYNNTGTFRIQAKSYGNEIPGLSPERDPANYIQLNRDYFTRAPQTGEPYFGYTKYTYPHPLRLALQTIPPSNAIITIIVL